MDSFEERDIGTLALNELHTSPPRKTHAKRPSFIRTSSSSIYPGSQHNHNLNVNAAQLTSPSSPDVSQFSFNHNNHNNGNDNNRSGVRNGVGNGHLGSRQLTRSNTLPRVVSAAAAIEQRTRISRKDNPEVDLLFTDPGIVGRLCRWITAVAIVEFDLDIGPVIAGVCPNNTKFTDSVWENIAFCSFPDSLQFEQGAQVHSFRVRTNTDIGFVYGFSHFNQRRDINSKRGYRQRSIVILTPHAWPSLFTTLVSTLGPLFEAHGVPMLESACQNIATWHVILFAPLFLPLSLMKRRSDPVGGIILELGFLGSVFNVIIPPNDDEQQLAYSNIDVGNDSTNINILALAPPSLPPPLLLFEASITHLWSIWECLMLCEPILVFGMSPAQTSQAIWWLRDLLRPIPLASDIRPYFTIQDQDHAALVNKMRPKPGLVLGVTNPFFERSCTHWPHILSLGATRTHQHGRADAHAGPKPGWETKTHKRHISKDHSLLKQAQDALLRGDNRSKLEAGTMLRAHFSGRAAAFLVPLNQYLNTLLPPPRPSSGTPTPSPSTSPSIPSQKMSMKPFNTADFMTTLKANKQMLPWKSSSKKVEFYERWLKSPAFGIWIASQDRLVTKMLEQR